MELEIEGDCETVFGCMKGVIVTVYSLVVICIIIRIMYKMHTYTHKKFSFEIIPLSSTIMQSLLQLILNVFIMDTKLIISALYSQTLTFGIISTSCSQLCLRIKYPHKSRTAKRYTTLAFCVAQLASLIMCLLTLFDVVPLDCNDWFSVAYLFPMGVMLIYTIASITFGSNILKILKNKDHEAQKIEGNDNTDQGEGTLTPNHTNSFPQLKMRTKSHMNNSMQLDREGQFFRQLKKQLQLIEFLFLFTIIVQVTMDAIRTYVLTDYIKCEGDAGTRSSEFQAYNNWGQVFLTFYQILQITPCLIAPYVFYYVPFKAKKVGGSILFSEQQFLSIALPRDDNDGDDSNKMEGSLDSRLLMSENFDFSREENFSQNYQNKQKYAALLGNKGEKVKTNPEKEKGQASPQNVDYLNNNQFNKSQKSNNSNVINYSNKSGKDLSNNLDSIYQLRRKHDDTLDDIDDFIDRMSMKKDDVERILSGQSNSIRPSLQMDKSASQNSMILSDNVLKLKEENSISINHQSSKQQSKDNSIRIDESNTTFNKQIIKNENVDQFRVTGDTSLEKKRNDIEKTK